jgi:hypothetical protein
LSYRTSFGAALGFIERSAQLMSAWLPGHEMQEAQNKIEAFRLFAYVDQELHFGAQQLPLRSMVGRARALSPWQMNFALEGVAYHYTKRAGAEARLADPDLPETAMVPMHAGMGTSLAGAALARAGDNPSKASLRGALEGFLELCQANSRAGWRENSVEAMGLAVRTLHPHLLMQASTAMGEIDAAAERLFWHGVGRSLYFVPMNFITLGGSHERALRAAIDEAPAIEDRHNAVAGLAWAVTLVNIRHPAVLENFLRASRGIRMSSAVSNGIVSALMVWKHMVPEGQVLAPYLRCAAPGADAELWNELVAAPAAHAFAAVFPALTGQDAPGQPTIASLFQYHDLMVNSHG